MISHDFEAWICLREPVSSDDDLCSVTLDFPFFLFDEPLEGSVMLLISEEIIFYSSFICRPALSLRSDKSFLKLTKSPLILVNESLISLTSSFILCWININCSLSLSISERLRLTLDKPDMAPSLDGLAGWSGIRSRADLGSRTLSGLLCCLLICGFWFWQQSGP
jgi:hypothetical protein